MVALQPSPPPHCLPTCHPVATAGGQAIQTQFHLCRTGGGGGMVIIFALLACPPCTRIRLHLPSPPSTAFLVAARGAAAALPAVPCAVTHIPPPDTMPLRTWHAHVCSLIPRRTPRSNPPPLATCHHTYYIVAVRVERQFTTDCACACTARILHTITPGWDVPHQPAVAAATAGVPPPPPLPRTERRLPRTPRCAIRREPYRRPRLCHVMSMPAPITTSP